MKLKDVMAELDAIEPEHWRAVIREKIANRNRWQVAHDLGEYLQYASDRMCPSRIYMIQLWWEEVQRLNGYRAIDTIRPTRASLRRAKRY